MDIFKPKKDFFALSFSDYRLRLAQADKKGKIRHYLEKELSPGIIERGVIKDKEGLTQVVAEFLKSAKLKQKFVVIGLSEIQAFTRVLTLPSLPLEELDDAAKWEAEPLLPFSLEKAYLDWMILEKNKEEIRALVVALPQALVESYSQILEGLGFQPIAFEITSLSLARLVEKNGVATMIIELKEKEAVLVVVGPGGGIEVSSTISFKDGSEAKEEFFSTIERLLNFYQKKRAGKDSQKKIAKIILCGQGAKEEWLRAVEEKTGIKSEVLNIKQADFASTISLAQKNVTAPIDEKTINLIPPRIQGLYDQAIRVREISAYLKFVLACLFLTFFSYSLAATHVYFETRRIEGKIVDLQALITPEALEIEKKANQLNDRAQKIVSLTSSQIEIASLLSLIRQIAPGEIVVTHFSFDGDRNLIFIDGLANHRNDLLAFQDSLEETGQFDEVHLPLSSLGKEANVSFTLSIAAKRKGS